MTKYSLSCLLCFVYVISFSQGEFVVEIDRTNGFYTKTGSAINGITRIHPNDRTFDELTATFIFPSAQDSEEGKRLYSINTANGATISDPVIENISTFEFDKTANMLYGIEKDNANYVKYFVSIDLTTGTITRVGGALFSSATYQGFSTFDESNQVYTFLAPPSILYSINAANGHVISSPNFVLLPQEIIVNFTFDNSTGILYGLLRDSELQKSFIVAIDPSTGIVTKIGTGASLGTGSGSAAIDQANQEYIYLYSNQQAGGYAIATFDIETGNIIYDVLIEPFNATTDINFFSLKYDNTQNKLFSIHWGVITSAIEPLPLDNAIKIYPNPFKEHAILEIGYLKNKTLYLRIYNAQGKLVSERGDIKGDKVTIEQGNLKNGVFYFQLWDNKQLIGRGEFIID